jgi:hypothetical protein
MIPFGGKSHETRDLEDLGSSDHVSPLPFLENDNLSVNYCQQLYAKDPSERPLLSVPW